MSLASLNFAAAANAGSPMTVMHERDRVPVLDPKGKPIVIHLLGKDSDIAVDAEVEARNRAVQALTDGASYSSAAADRDGGILLAKLTTGWSYMPKCWIEGGDDETSVPFSYAAAEALYNNRGVRWLRTQADKHIGNRANLLKASVGG